MYVYFRSKWAWVFYPLDERKSSFPQDSFLKEFPLGISDVDRRVEREFYSIAACPLCSGGWQSVLLFCSWDCQRSAAHSPLSPSVISFLPLFIIKMTGAHLENPGCCRIGAWGMVAPSLAASPCGITHVEFLSRTPFSFLPVQPLGWQPGPSNRSLSPVMVRGAAALWQDWEDGSQRLGFPLSLLRLEPDWWGPDSFPSVPQRKTHGLPLLTLG